jgi:two-component system sensor histidine kinase AlgZ
VTESPSIAEETAGSGEFLPDLCRPQAVLAVAVGGQLLAVLLALAQPFEPARFWPRLGVWSLAVQWVALLGIAGLCAARPWLRRLPAVPAAVAALGWLLLLAAGTTLAAMALGVLPGGGTALGWLLTRNLLLTAMVGGATLRLLYQRHALRQRERAHARAQLAVLQARMRPHFLFNSLNTIASLTAVDPLRAEEVTLALADLLRASLQAGERLIPLDEELTLCRQYLAMEQLRLGERLQLDWPTTVPAVDVRVPPLSVQPLLENAIVHGVEPLVDGGCVSVRVAAVAPDVVEVRIDNPCGDGAGGGGLHMALANVRARLEGHFGAAASLREAVVEGRHRVCLRLPAAAGILERP